MRYHSFPLLWLSRVVPEFLCFSQTAYTSAVEFYIIQEQLALTKEGKHLVIYSSPYFRFSSLLPIPVIVYLTSCHLSYHPESIPVALQMHGLLFPRFDPYSLLYGHLGHLPWYLNRGIIQYLQPQSWISFFVNHSCRVIHYQSNNLHPLPHYTIRTAPTSISTLLASIFQEPPCQ